MDLAYAQAYTIEGFDALFYKDPTTLYTITDFSDDRYYFTRENDEIIYHFSERVIIDKEVFCDTSGKFRIYLYATDIDGPRYFESGSVLNFTYEKQGEDLLIYLSYIGVKYED